MIPQLLPPETGVTIRMYNPGFGDCFLLAFHGEDGQARYMLIDCGVHHQYSGGKQKIKRVVEDIAKATNNHLHAVVATHEHTDHLWGFKYGKEVFDQIAIEDLWLAWTEDPVDDIARQLKELYGMRIRALSTAVKHFMGLNESMGKVLQGVLDFENPAPLAAAAGEVTILDYLRSKSKKKLQKPDDYLHPGEKPLTLPGVEGVKFYVLGPPRSDYWIKMLPKESKEIYPELALVNEIEAFTSALFILEGANTMGEEDRQLYMRCCPFEESLKISKKEANDSSYYGGFFQSYYGFAKQEEDGPEWRRIDNDWMSTAEQLALKINNYTNNTSLVLAIELTETTPHKVLLFSADAQIGNMLSWHQKELEWPGEGENSETVNASYLLKRTVLYKVGHHGSRNATLRAKGLELMESTDLVAMIPVDEAWAKDEARGWEHPAEKLLNRINERTKGRIIRSDKIPTEDEPLNKPAEATEEEWRDFVSKLEWDQSPDRLWIQYTISE